MRRTIGVVVAVVLSMGLGSAEAAERASALELALAARPGLAGTLSEATRAVLSVISAEEAQAVARGEIGLDDLRLPDGTSVRHFLRSVLGVGTYAVPFYSMDAGGGESLAGSSRVLGTVGQPDAATSAGGTFTLVGGFRGRLSDFTLFSDGFETGDTSRWSATAP